MSVYTPVTPAELEAWLARYAVGSLTGLQPIASGIENTNYFVDTIKGRYVLTLYERMPTNELPFYLNLMAHLAHDFHWPRQAARRMSGACAGSHRRSFQLA
jgi:homoserine kinase type II